MLMKRQIRVWGGGIVESDHFYEICDREGILVWQDFLFACGDYPASPDFIAAVKEEDEGHIKRVGHHASKYSPGLHPFGRFLQIQIRSSTLAISANPVSRSSDMGWQQRGLHAR